jgi:hypothetical protein
MQADLKRGKVAFRMRGVGLSVAILASATLSLSAPDRALASCGTSSHPAHSAASGNGGNHAVTSTVARSGGSGGGGGTLGCAGGSSTSSLRGLPTTSSGRVVEMGASAHAARPESHVRNAPTRTTGATAHLHTVKAAHRG